MRTTFGFHEDHRGYVVGLSLFFKFQTNAILAMFHLDRQVECTGKDFSGLLEEHSVKQSMRHKGDCRDNAMAESFLGTLKKELLHGGVYSRRDDARLAIFEYIEVF